MPAPPVYDCYTPRKRPPPCRPRSRSLSRSHSRLSTPTSTPTPLPPSNQLLPYPYLKRHRAAVFHQSPRQQQPERVRVRKRSLACSVSLLLLIAFRPIRRVLSCVWTLLLGSRRAGDDYGDGGWSNANGGHGRHKHARTSAKSTSLRASYVLGKQSLVF